MTWEKIVGQGHVCAKPWMPIIVFQGARAGSIWRCDVEGCGKRWVLRKRGDVHVWEPVA